MIGFVITKERVISFIAMISLLVLCFMYFLIYRNHQPLSTKYEIRNTDRERRAFIESYGYTLSDEPAKKESFYVPTEFGITFMQFERLQNEMGLSLIPFNS